MPNIGQLSWATPAPSGVVSYICVADQKAQNTHGGTFTSGAWRTRTLNTVVYDSHSLVLLSSNQVILPPGRYRCAITAPAAFVKEHQARLQNMTTGTSGGVTLLTGTSAYTTSSDTDVTVTQSMILGGFFLAIRSALEVQHQCNTTRANTGFGAANNFGIEVFTVAEFWREA